LKIQIIQKSTSPNMEDTAATFTLRYWDENKEMDSMQQALPGVLL
jgi:hypothetical protein